MKIRTIFYITLLFFLSQGCVVYHKNSVSIDQAVDQGKVKMRTKSGQVYKFENIELRDSTYYGKGREYLDQYAYIVHEDASTPIDSAMHQVIYVKDVKKSKRRTVLLIVGVSLPVAYLVTGFLFFLVGGI